MAKSVVERRRHKRHSFPCPATLQRAGKDKPDAIPSKTIDLSDGGAMLAVPIKVVPHLSEKVRVVFNIPRETPNTRMMEEFTCEAKVIRHQPLQDNEIVGVALQFEPMQRLGLEV